MEALYEALIGINTLHQTYETNFQNLLYVEQSLKEYREGAYSLSAYFTLKSNETIMSELEAEKVQLEKTIADIGSVIKLASFKLESQIEIFKMDKSIDYYKQILYVSEAQRINWKKLSDVWDSILSDKNIKII